MKNQLFLFTLGTLFLFGCTNNASKKIISIKNSLSIKREFETIELTKEFLKVEDLNSLSIKDIESGKLLITQTVDSDFDGIMDQILFQPEIKGNSEKQYEIVLVTDDKKPAVVNYCYSRFVPERTDDYAWENNKVAFRVFGPTAQKMIEENIKGGTLSSGVDAWLKRVEHPIINNWYKKETETEGTYHEDTGEGLDNFHVGISRGVGGIAIKDNNTYYYSKNYTKWQTITVGPIRTSFYLEYENWDANGKSIKESKIISLDYGNNLSKFETTIEGANQIASGLTLHEKDGEVSGSDKNGWVSYWQPHKDSELGTAIITQKAFYNSFEKYDTEAKDESNAYINLNVLDKKVTYYAGFTWLKAKQYKGKKEWESYLNTFSEKINNPLVVRLSE